MVSMFHLTLANMRYKPFNAAFHILLLAFGVATIMAISHLNAQLDRQFQKDLKGIDLVVGGKGSPLQIILASVFHLDIPTGNIPVAAADKLRGHPLIKQAIPMALGDNYNGFRIVGTTPDYVAHYNGELAVGVLFSKPMDVVMGAEVARISQVQVGEKIVGAHGLSNSGDLHTDSPYNVVGIFKPSGTVLDRLVLTPMESVWNVHAHPDPDEPDEVAYQLEHPEKEITALLMSYKSPMAAVTLPRLINTQSSMQAASPAYEVARLNRLMTGGSDVLRVVGIVMVVFAGLGVFVTLFNAVHERHYDMILLRTLGASRAQILRLMIGEAVMIGVLGAGLGWLLAIGFMGGVSKWLGMTKHLVLDTVMFDPMDMVICSGAIVIALVAGLIPAILAYRLNIVEVLQRP